MPNILITGGAKRLGADVARHFAALGWNVVVHYRSSATEAEALAEELNRNRKVCALVQGALDSQRACHAVFDGARAAFGPVDLLLNNASSFVNDDITDLTDASFDTHFEVNLRAPVFLAQAMDAQGDNAHGLIVNMLDNKLDALNPDFFTYTVSKAALKAATEMLALRFDGRPRVCGIAPSIVLISGKQSHENFVKSSRINPLKRRVSPADIAATVEYLWNDGAANGQIVTLDGGQALWALPRDVAFLVKEGQAG